MKVYRNSALKGQGVSDKKQVAVEVLQEVETITPKEFLTVVRAWNPETLEISPSFEIIVDKTKSLKYFAEKIHEKKSIHLDRKYDGMQSFGSLEIHQI